MRKIVCLIMACLICALFVGCDTPETTPKHTLNFVEGRDVTITVNETDKTYFAVFCDYTNNSGETCLPCDGIDVTAFQNGIELTVMVFTGKTIEDAIQCDTAVQSGTTARVVWLFEKRDSSPVSIEFSDGQKFVV